MKTIVTTMMILMMGVGAFAQASGDPIVEKTSNGYIKVSGIDALGATVSVLYNDVLVKVYQERTENNVTTFARFAEGQVIEYGTFEKPMVQNADMPGRGLSVQK
jgi:hypothetical protein